MSIYVERFKRIAGMFAAVAFIVLACGVLLPTSAHAKSYVVDDVAIKANLDAKGGMDVTEKRAFDFSGDYSFVYWEFPVDSGQAFKVDKVSVAENEGGATILDRQDVDGVDGSYTLSTEGDVYRLTAYKKASDEKLTYTITYHYDGVIGRYADTAELYWQFIGKGWGVPTNKASIVIYPPSTLAKKDVLAWAHGPLNGNVSIGEDGSVKLAVDNLPASTFVEARALYPPTVFATAAASDANRKQAVIAEETAWANKANTLRRDARIKTGLVKAAGLLAAIVIFGIVLWMYMRFGKEHPSTLAMDGRYWRDDPDPTLPPAMIGCLWRFGEVTPDDIVATVMQMTDQGVIAMNENRKEEKSMFGHVKTEITYDFVVDVEKLAGEHSLNRSLVETLMATGAGNTFTFESIKAYAKSDAKTYAEKLDAWKAQVKGEVEAAGYIESDSVTAQTIAGILVVADIVVAGVVGAYGGSLIFALIIAAFAIPSAVFTALMKRRSKEGDELYRRYTGIRNYLKDFSRLDEAPPTSVVIWNRYLVLATVFGIADEVSKQLAVTLPQVVNDSGFGTSYIWFYGGMAYANPAHMFASSIASASSVAASQMSSGAGFGGGFSGGGGFGGGGGGGGAG